MRIALWDIAGPLKDRLRPFLDRSDVLVDIDTAPPQPVGVDVVVASRFGEADARRATYRLLQAPGAGVDKIAIDAVDPAAWLCNAYEHEGPIAEYVFAAILDHALNYGNLTQRIANEGWAGAYFSRPAHGEIAGKTLGLIGLGHIGAAIAHRAKAFGMNVMAIAATPRAKLPPDVDWIATAERLSEMLPRVDYLVLAAPLTESTRGMLAMPQFRSMKKSAVIVNIARAEIAVEEDLYEALKQGVIGGAVIDAWYRYPASKTDAVTPSRFPFEALPNVRMTPHSAAWTDALWDRRLKMIADNVRRLEKGAPLLNVVRAPVAQAARSAG
jgi:phosphoglycerate dehydrogenase-like enzyme